MSFDPRDIRALLFDFGGVLVRIDFDRVVQRWADLAHVPFEQVKRRFHHGAAYEAHERGEIDSPRYFATLRRDLGLDLDDAQIADGWAQVLLPEIEPTTALLPHLARNIPCHVFSNTNPAHAEEWLTRYTRALAPLTRRFLSHEIGHRKPEPAAYAFVARELGLEPARILFFDDTAANVEGARAAGMPAVHVHGPEDIRRAVQPWLR